MSSLSDMPDVAMDRILANCDFVAIQILRKVCHVLRNYIDDKVPDSQFKRIAISKTAFQIVIDYVHGDFQKVTPSYHQNNDSTIIHYGRRNKTIDEKPCIDTFSDDFQQILRHQKSILPEFTVDLRHVRDNEFIDSMKNILESRIPKLQVKNLEVYVADTSAILEILPYLDSKILNSIGIYVRDPGRNEDESLLKFDEIVELEQWKKAKEVYASRRIDEIPLSHFQHFSKGFVMLKKVTKDGMIGLKEKFLNAPGFRNFCIDYSVFEDIDDFLTYLGPVQEVFNQKQWYFPSPIEGKVLSIFHDLPNHQFTFGLINMGFVVEDVQE